MIYIYIIHLSKLLHLIKFLHCTCVCYIAHDGLRSTHTNKNTYIVYDNHNNIVEFKPLFLFGNSAKVYSIRRVTVYL